MFLDSYADKYQKFQGFETYLLDKDGEKVKAYLSFKPSTRSTYDLAMRDATIDGLITFDNPKDLKKLKLSQIFYTTFSPNDFFIIQAINKIEQQPKSKNIYAIKQNCHIGIQRKEYDEESKKNKYKVIYDNIRGFVSIQNQGQKNFSAGVENTTILNMEIPKRNIEEDYVYDIRTLDRIILEDLERTVKNEVKIESIDAYGVPGVIRIQGTFETRTGDSDGAKIRL